MLARWLKTGYTLVEFSKGFSSWALLYLKHIQQILKNFYLKYYSCVPENLGNGQILDLKQALIRSKAVRMKLKLEQYCFQLWHFKALILALKYFMLQILSQPISFGQEHVIVHFWQLHCVKGPGSALLGRNGSLSVQMKGEDF